MGIPGNSRFDSPGDQGEQPAALEYSFVETAGGVVTVEVAGDAQVLADALADSVGTRPPKGAPQDGPSTYWIDRALARLHTPPAGPREAVIASGNTTHLLLNDGVIEARYNFDPPDSEDVDAVPSPELIKLLEHWRRRVLELDSDAARRMPAPAPGRSSGSAGLTDRHR